MISYELHHNPGFGNLHLILRGQAYWWDYEDRGWLYDDPIDWSDTCMWDDERICTFIKGHYDQLDKLSFLIMTRRGLEETVREIAEEVQ